MARAKRKAIADPHAETYEHKDKEALLRPDIGLQAQFKTKKPPAKYKYDFTRDPQLAWAGKAERTSFEVPTLPLFVHERLATKAILETLKGHKADPQLTFDFFSDPKLSITDRILKAYEHKDRWVNRMILGDSLVVMNSLLHYEGLGEQVQMIYMDPPYGVNFGSNFQPFVRKRDVKHNDDGSLTREPEMVQAYRDTWELGVHSYLTYLRDRLQLARELLSPTGSLFVQISDENLHHVRELLDEVFGAENFCSVITYQTSVSAGSRTLDTTCDYILWYARDKTRVKFRNLYRPLTPGETGATRYNWIESPDGKVQRLLTAEEQEDPSTISAGWRLFTDQGLTSRGVGSERTMAAFEFEGETFSPTAGHWRTAPEGLAVLAAKGRILKAGKTLRFKKCFDDFPYLSLTNMWNDTGGGIQSRKDPKIYVVQTTNKIIQRCLLMTTDPGDLVLDPTCGSGTTAYVAEQWGRRWITLDTSRVPLALARQRLLTATYPYYELQDPAKGPGAGFVYRRRQNKKGEEVGGIVPHITLKSIANNEPPEEEVLVDRPELDSSVTRVSGPITVEATIPTPVDFDADGTEDSRGKAPEEYARFADRMLEVLRRSPVLRISGTKTITFKNVRPPAKTLSLSAEALVANGKDDQAVAFVFGPENGSVSEKLIFNAAKEANGKHYTHLYVIGFAIEPDARQAVERCAEAYGIPATYVQATLDLIMGDLLKSTRASQIFSVCGLPEVRLTKLKKKENGRLLYRVELVGLDVFDPVTMEASHRDGDDVPTWFLDTDYNELCFHVSQAFFPRTSAWDNLKRALKGVYEDSVWDHLAGTKSEPFPGGGKAQIAVKVIDDRGNELMVVKPLAEAEPE